MPHRRKRSDGQRQDRRVEKSYVALLEESISAHTGLPGYGSRWVKKWLLDPGSKTLVPPDASVTLIEGLRMLFEYPYGTVLYKLGCLMKVRFELIIAVGDVLDTQVIVHQHCRILRIWRHRPEKFRFQNRTELERWMSETAAEIRTIYRRNPR